ncbi:10111_t:CDS:2, partial [Paraglomus occultum]
DDVRATFERIAKSTPEVVFLGLAQIKKPWNALHQELVNRQLMMFLSGHSSGIFVLNLLWQLNSELFSEGCIELYNKDPANVSRILDLAQELKVLNPLLEKRPFAFAIDLAALASRRQYLNLEKWLTDNIANHGTTFVYECLDLLNHEIVTRAISDASTANQSPRLTYDVVVIFLRVLQGSQLSADKAEMLREIHDVAVRLYPRLLSLGSSAAAVATNGEATFSEDVEAQANSYY